MKLQNTDEKIQAKRITRLLDSGLERLEPRVIEALHTGRQRALQHQRSKSALWSGIGVLSLRWAFAAHHPHLIATLPLLLVLGIGSLTFWQHEKGHDPAHIDIAILTDDMPMEVFVDPHHY
ncbi:MAG: DUF3619 family protein [Gallionella sp.]|jgi:hypothetical protein|nr:DUF3619 family protein [Gallionella sp.]